MKKIWGSPSQISLIYPNLLHVTNQITMSYYFTQMSQCPITAHIYAEKRMFNCYISEPVKGVYVRRQMGAKNTICCRLETKLNVTLTSNLVRIS